jgi:hypothetical protein
MAKRLNGRVSDAILDPDRGIEAMSAAKIGNKYANA